jgi:hypothetical protein
MSIQLPSVAPPMPQPFIPQMPIVPQPIRKIFSKAWSHSLDIFD